MPGAARPAAGRPDGSLPATSTGGPAGAPARTTAGAADTDRSLGPSAGAPAPTAVDPVSEVRQYRVTHRTVYLYGEPAVAGHTVARVEPRTLPHQQVRRATLDIQPEPSHWSHHDDGYGNHVTHLAFDEPHDRLVITATSEVAVTPRPLPEPGWSAPWERAVEALTGDVSDDGLLARACRLDSPLVTRHPDLRAFAADAFTPRRPLGEAATELTTRIFDEWEFVAGATDVETPVLQVLGQRRGVCQDFAHLLLGALRSLDLGARYVSGYIETEPPAGRPRLVGADASHAWVSLYVPGQGWVDLDPTNGLAQPDRHVTIGWGRDYTDVVPVRGVLFGPRADQQLEISVDVAAI
jgi:transglutaminase-like putative cysteine protease